MPNGALALFGIFAGRFSCHKHPHNRYLFLQYTEVKSEVEYDTKEDRDSKYNAEYTELKSVIEKTGRQMQEIYRKTCQMMNTKEIHHK